MDKNLKKKLMNNGERNELILKLKLIQLRDRKEKITIDNNLITIDSVGFLHEYRKIGEDLNFDLIRQCDDSDLVKLTQKYGIIKSPAKSKADVYVNGIGISLKSIENAPPAIVNHTTRIGFEKACEISEVDIELIDEIISEYWDLRRQGIIKEDIHNLDIHSPFKGKRDILKPVLDYFLFDGSGQGRSQHGATLILDYNSPIDIRTWNTYNRENSVNLFWDKLVFSIRSKGMLPKYPKIDKRKYDSISKWTEFHQDKYRGSLHIRTK